MKAKDVIVGRCYLMKVGGQVVPCQLLRVFEQPRGLIGDMIGCAMAVKLED